MRFSVVDKIWRLFRQLNLRNLRALWKAVREEPLDLVLENFWQLLRSGRRQSIYTDKFFAVDEFIKVYVQDCRKSHGSLQLVLWVLSARPLKQPGLYAGRQELQPQIHTFIRPELEALFSAFDTFQQGGFILQQLTTEAFSDIHLELRDEQGHQLSLPVGRHFLYEAEPGQMTDLPESPGIFWLLLHDWDGALSTDQIHHALRAIPDSFFSSFTELFFVSASGIIVELPEIPGTKIRQLTFAELSGTLISGTFDYLLFLSARSSPGAGMGTRLAIFCNEQPQLDLIYFDEHSREGEYFHSPVLKPAFSPERLEAENYIGPNYCISRQLGARMGWFSEADVNAGGYELLLRAPAHTMGIGRLHDYRLPLVAPSNDEYLRSAAAEQLVREKHFNNLQIESRPGFTPEAVEVFNPLTTSPLVSIIIPFKDKVGLLKRCLQSIMAHTTYPHFEVLLVSNNSEAADTYTYLDEVQKTDDRLRVLRWDQPFNYAGLNNWAATQAKGNCLLFLNNDVEVITQQWLYRLLTYLEQPDVGAVGAKLLYPDHTVQHAGIIVGYGGSAAHPFKHFPDNFGGYEGLANKVRNVSACTAACLLVRRDLFTRIGGFDEHHLPIAFNDVDLCLEISRRNYRIVYTPFVKLLHYESISRGVEDTPEKRRRARREVAWFRKKWRQNLRAGDPYYHPQLSLRRSDYETL